MPVTAAARLAPAPACLDATVPIRSRLPGVLKCGGSRRLRVRASSIAIEGGSPKFEINVCVQKVCKRQGSRQILRFAEDLRIENTEVRGSGCLGKCGNGPNLALVTPTKATTVGHVSSPHRLAGVLNQLMGIEVDEADIHATELRTMGTSLAQSGDLKGAIEMWDQAIELQPAHGLHAIYSNRSAAKLTLGESEDALEDALKAVQLAPRDFITVWRHCGCAAVISFRGARSRG
mmetsp:Transcript_35913/g.101719  ORF Transcript_35913/g.101719 Transcript_35913/m.101719 type:complete len:233 (-) Transcript_35913:639-1337(-)